MRALRLPAIRGLAWITEGYRLFAKSPLLLVLLILAYWFLMLGSNVIPILGPLAATALIPTFSVGLMVACRALDRGEAAEMNQLFTGFRSNFPALLRLGLAYLVSTVAILAISALFDGGTLMKMMLLGVHPAADFGDDDGLLLATEVAMLLFVPVLMGFWFAPMLAAWHGMPAFKSIFFSYFACLHNVRAFLIYGAVLATLAIVVPAVLFALLAAILQSPGVKFAVIVVMPFFLVLVATVFASFYTSYRDIFREPEASAAAPDATPES
jgi:hypothetical protein